ncbi:MAG: ABC transporter substrate-binding protein [Clostridia bacterium]|nr:ABC transporter substrate-binding protein [Clostridia bacterium]
MNSNDDGYDKTLGSIQVTDENNITVGFDEPVTHIASLGRSITLVLDDFSYTDRIVAMDKYSAFEESKIPSMQDSEARIVGTYNTDSSATVQVLMKMVQDGEFDIRTGVVIGYNASYYSSVLDSLDSNGFKVLRYYPENVDQMKGMASDIGSLVGKSEMALEMCQNYDDCLNTVKETMDARNVEKVSVLYVRGTATKPQVGLSGSLSAQIIEGAYAKNAGVDFINASEGIGIDISKTTCDLTSTMGYFGNEGGSDYQFVIVDGAYKATDSRTPAEQFLYDRESSAWKNYIGKEGVEYLSMERDWNTFSIVHLTEGIYSLANMLYGNGEEIFPL